MVPLSDPGVEGRTRPAAPAYTTMATLSSGPSWSTSIPNAVFRRGSLSGLFMDPETSRRKTRLLAGASAMSMDFPFMADPNQAVEGLPWSRSHFGVDRQRVLSDRGLVAVGEVVDQFFDADRIDGGPNPVPDEPANVGVGSPVHIDGEGGEGIRGRGQEDVFLDVGVGFGIEVRVEAARRGPGGMRRGRHGRGEASGLSFLDLGGRNHQGVQGQHLPEPGPGRQCWCPSESLTVRLASL